MTDVMLDFETMGTSPSAPVIQIGACYFDRKTGEIGRTFKTNVSLESCVAAGAKIDAATVLWWMDQSEAARNSVLQAPCDLERSAFTTLNKFLQGCKAIWSHSTFDFVILAETLRRLGISPTFTYRSARDIRTLQDLADYPPGEPRQGVQHDALDDCKFQVSYCVAALNKLCVGS